MFLVSRCHWTNTDFDVAWWPPGTWLNYTRTFPTNTYVIYGRLANGGAYSNATMSLVTPGNTPSGHVLGSQRQRIPILALGTVDEQRYQRGGYA